MCPLPYNCTPRFEGKVSCFFHLKKKKKKQDNLAGGESPLPVTAIIVGYSCNMDQIAASF